MNGVRENLQNGAAQIIEFSPSQGSIDINNLYNKLEQARDIGEFIRNLSEESSFKVDKFDLNVLVEIIQNSSETDIIKTETRDDAICRLEFISKGGAIFVELDLVSMSGKGLVEAVLKVHDKDAIQNGYEFYGTLDSPTNLEITRIEIGGEVQPVIKLSRYDSTHPDLDIPDIIVVYPGGAIFNTTESRYEKRFNNKPQKETD